MAHKEHVLDLANPRWGAAIERHPDLAPAVELQRQVVARQLELGELLGADVPVRLELGPQGAAEKLSSDIPVLVGEPVVFELDLTRFVMGFCQDLARGEAGGAANRLSLLFQGSINVNSLVSASISRQQEAIRTKANHVGVSADLLWLVAELAAGSLAHRLQRDLFSSPRNAQVNRALSTWRFGYCPACGSWPAFAERSIRGNESSLRCSFCGYAWRPLRSGCIYCDDSPDELMTAILDDTQPDRRLELCRHCAGYLKELGLDGPTPFELIGVEDLCSSDLDVAAAEKGYRRPVMRNFPPPSRDL